MLLHRVVTLLFAVVIVANNGFGKDNFRLIPQIISVMAPTAKLYLLVDLKSNDNLEVNCFLKELSNHGARIRRHASDGHILPSDSEDIVKEDPTSIYLGTLGAAERPNTTLEKLNEASKDIDHSVTEAHLDKEIDLPAFTTAEPTIEETLNDTIDFQANLTEKPQLSGVSYEPEREIGAWKLLKYNYIFTQHDLLLPVELEYNSTDACVQGALTLRCFSANNTSYTESLIVYDIKPLLNATAKDSSKERIYHLPQYIDIAPCPCNLIQGGCDTDCCCDEDCSKLAKGTFACSTETRLEKLISKNQCEAGRKGVICIEDCTVPYVGHFHNIEPILHSLVAYTKRLKNLISRRNNLSTEVEFQWTSHYKMGVPVKAITRGVVSFWEVPRQVVGSLCLNSSPIIFLENMNSLCVRHMTPGFCINEQIFSVGNFAFNYTDDQSRSIVLVLDLSSRNISSSSVEYWCVKNMSTYLQIRNRFPDWKQMLNNDTVFTKYNDDVKPVTSLVNSLMCQNVVLEAHYIAVWQGQYLREVKQHIVLADVPDGTSQSPVTLTQYFSVTYEHFTSATQKTTCKTEGKMCDVEHEDGFFTWQPDANGMCQQAAVRASMGETTSSSCWLTVDDEHLQDCAKYRSFLCEHQKMILDSAFRYTYIETQNASTVVLNKNDSCRDVEMNATNCNFLPTHMVIEVVYADQAMVADAPSVAQILGVSVGFQPEPCLPCIGGTDIYCTTPANLKINTTFPAEETKNSSNLLPCNPRKRILLSSTVRFIVADVDAVVPIKEFWRRMFSSCPGGVCWWHLNDWFRESIYDNQLLADSMQWIVALFAILTSLLVVWWGLSARIR